MIKVEDENPQEGDIFSNGNPVLVFLWLDIEVSNGSGLLVWVWTC